MMDFKQKIYLTAKDELHTAKMQRQQIHCVGNLAVSGFYPPNLELKSGATSPSFGLRFHPISDSSFTLYFGLLPL